MKNLAVESISPGVWVFSGRFPRSSNEDGQTLVAEIDKSPMKRARICMHQDISDRMQEMLIAFDGASFVRPSYHKDKDESFHMLDGFGKYVFFDDAGAPTEDVRLGPYESDLPFYCRIPANLPHTLVVYSEYALAHEVSEGPFEKANTIFPAWSPDHNTAEDIDGFRKKYSELPAQPISSCKYERVTEEMCRAEPGVVSISRKDLEYLKSEVNQTSRKRIRLCVHQDDAAKMHEMFVVYTGSTYVRANVHIGKDESLHILEGTADFIFFDDDGNIIDVIELSDKSGGNNYFIRVPQKIYHTIIMRSEYMIIHESTPGPFDRGDTLWAPWAPSDEDTKAVASYQEDLEERIQSFKK